MKKVYAFFTALLVAMLLIPWQLNAQVLLNENFDNLTSGVPTGWSVEGTASSSYHWKSTESYSGWSSLKTNGTPGLYFYCYYASGGSTSILKTPAVDLSSSTKDMILSFELLDADQDEIKVYLSKDGGATYEENLLLTCEKIEASQIVEIPLAAYKNEKNVSIVWYGVSSYGSSSPVLDNVSIAPAPTCAVAENLAVTDLSQNDATFTWKLATGKGSPAEQFAFEVFKVGVNTAVYTELVEPDVVDGVYSYTVEGELESGTAYYFTIKGICGADDEAAIATSQLFYTLCDPFVLPLALDTVTETALQPCWTMNDADYLSNTVYLNSANTFFATPVLNHAANDIEVSLRYAGTSVGKGFYYGIANADGSGFDTLGFVVHTATYSERKISVNTANTKYGNATGKVFAIRPDNYMYIYGINVHAKPCCPRVEQVTAAALDSASIEVSWLGAAASYNITLVDTATNTTINRTATTNPVTLGDLAPQTSYLVLVQAVCGDCSSAMSDSIFVSTLCGVGDANLNESFEYEELGSVMPECWIQSKKDAWIVNHNISYYDTPNNAANGHSAIYMYYYAVEKGKTATFSPQPFNVATPGQYDVKFAMYRYSKGYASEGDGTLTVWANNRPDTVGATKVCEIDRYFECAPIEKAAGWYYYDFNIPTVTGTVYLVFEGKSNATNNLYLDDISVYPAPTCRKVRNIAIDDANITTTAVPVKWEAAEGTSQWVVEYQVLAGETVVKSDSILTSNNPFSIEGLTPSTAYKVTGTVATYCDEANRGEEIAFSFDVQTKCEALSTFPYFEGFENQFPPICWDMKNTAGNVDFVWKKYDSQQYVYEGTYAAYWSYKSSGSKAILVTPEFVFEDDKDYRIEFFAFRGTSGTSYAGEGFGVYLSETPNVTEESELLAFIPRLTSESSDKGILSVPTVSAQGMYQYKIDFNTTEHTGKYVIFEALTNNGYYQSLDNLWIGEKPAIDIIAKFNVDSVVIDAARITIPDETVAMFDIVYGAKGFDPTAAGTIVDSIEGRVYSLTALTPDTEYDVYVRARNAAGQVSDWSRNAISFRTLCSAAEILPTSIFVENFDEYEANTTFMGCLVHNYSGSYSFKVGENMSFYNNDTYEYDYVYAKTGSKMAMINSSNGAWMFRAVSLKAGVNYSISVDAVEWSSYYDAKLSMGVASSPDRNAVTKCLDSYILPDRAAWERVTGYFTVPADGIYYVGVGAEYGSSAVGIDSLVIRTEAVIPPAVNITALTDNSVSFALTSNAYSWELYYATAKFNPDTINPALFTTVEELTHTVTGLESNTTYYYAFRSFTEEDDASSWTSLGSFQTECGAVELPLAQGFESAAPSCWTITGEGDHSLRAYNKQEGSYSWMVSGNKKLISPRVNGDLSNCEGSFWAGGQYEGERYTPKFIIGVMTNPQDPTTFKAVTDTISVDYLVADGQLQEFKFSLESLKNDPIYKDAKYLVFEHIQGYTFLDALTVEVIPTCPRPDGFEATAVTANTITLDWATGKANEASWSILVKQGNDTVQSLVANAHPYVVNGLTGNTTYSFELRALCAANDSSKVVELKNITTACDVYTLPYEHTLNGIPACWTVEDNNSSDYWTWTGGSGLTQLSTSMADSYACDTARLFSPEFNISSKAILSIDMYTYYEAGTFNILFDNGTTRDTIVANYQHHNAWDTVQYDLTKYQGQTGRFVFEGYGPTQTGWAAYWYLRNFAIVEKPAQYNVAGSEALTGFNWDVTKNTMAYNAETGVYTLTFSNVPAGEHQLKVAKDASWDDSWGFASLDATNSSAKVYEKETNIAFTLAAVADVTVEFNPEANTVKVTTTGEFVDAVVLKNVYVAGSAGLCNGVNWDPGAAVNKMDYDYATGEYVKVFTNVAAGTYEFKITQGDWNKSQFTNVDAACSDKGWEGGNGNNIKFTLKEAATVTIKLTAAEKVCLTSTIGEFGKVEITSYTLVGDAAVFGTSWDVANNANNMVQEGETNTWTKVYENVLLEAKEYSYKVVGNHAYEIFEYPVGNATLSITETGYYTITFTLVNGEEPSLTANAVKYVAPAVPAKPAIQYGGGYFTADNLPVALTTTETRPNYILVTIDGSEPTFEGVQVGTTLPATNGQQIPMTAASTTIKARGMLFTEAGQPYQNPDGTYVYGEVASATFTKVEAPAAPVFTPVAGEYFDSVTVSIACATENVMVKYEFGGTEPTGRSATYTEPFKLTSTTVVSAIAFLTDAEGAPIMDVEGMPIASLAAFSEYKVTPYVAPEAPAVPTIQYGGGYFTSDMLQVVVNTTEARPSYILVTIDGSEPSFEGVMSGATLPAAPGQPIQLTATTTVKVRGLLVDTSTGQPYQNPDGSYVYSEVASATFTKVEAPAAPVFTPVAGEYADSVVVSIACATENVMIKYEFGGTEPTGRSATYTEPFKLTSTTVVSAMVFLTDAEGAPIMDVEEMPIASAVTFAEYKVKETIVVANPVFTPAAGEYLDKETLEVTLTCATADAKIYWTYGTDASVNQYSFEYERAIPIDAKNNTISAIAVVFDDNAKVVAKSEVVYATYTLKEKEVKPIEINFTPAPGEYEGSVNVTIEYLNVPDGGMCMYSIDGTDPMREYKSTTTITLTETTTVKARVLISMSPSFQFSETVEAVYTIKPAQPEYEAPAAPVFTPEAGEFIDSVAVSMTCETENAIILYDVLGLTPNFTSPRFEGEPIIIKETTTIAAIAVLVDAEGEVILNADEMPYMSEVVTATYVVKPGEGVDVDNVELVAVVYAKGGMVYVDTELGNMIEVFTVQGQCLYAAEATAQLTAIDTFNANVVLVKVNGKTVKVAIK